MAIPTENTDIEQAIEYLYRNDWARILATLVRQTRDLDAAEDTLQEAMARAVASWPSDGLPDNPSGWISTVAQRIAVETARRSGAMQARLPLLVIPDEPDASLHGIDLAFRDDRLRLIFTCCHPLLSSESRLALTLRMVCGLSTADLASLFIVQESTMAARITRAKKKLAASGVPYHIPAPADLEDRLQDVLAVIHLIATAAHTPATGDRLHNATHMQLALDLTAVIMELIPAHAEVQSLRALVMFTEARRESRVDAAGNALPLDRMDRTLWDHHLISQALKLTEESLRGSQPNTVGPYALQAAIAAVHAEAECYEETDWAQIAAVYAVLDHRHPGTVVRLGYAISVGMHRGPTAGLEMIEQSNLDTALPTYAMLPAARADLHRRAGNNIQAAREYTLAADLTTNETLSRWFLDQAKIMG